FCAAMLVFFFSSRRRHTRSKRDWSSDVCSSDLYGRRLLGLRFSASGRPLTHPLNLPAPGRCQPLYFAFLASQRPVFLINSRLGLFTAAYPKSKHPFSLRYGVILPSSLTRVLPLTFAYSPCLPVSVPRTGSRDLTRGFSWQCGIRNFVCI